jgi:type IV pilus assembly protein PilA
MSDSNDPLSRTKPLADPLRVITILTVIGACFLALVTFPLHGALAALGVALSALSFALLISPGGKPNAIYLRAFRTDRSTAKLRARLAAILGPGFRLSGIRPPREKTSLFLRFLLPGLVAMRYAGSKFMELEAGDDWMARLWKTYQSTRLVFVDVRDVTPYVHQEIEMTLESMGTARCIFVVGPGKTEQEWRQTVAAIARPESDPARFQLLDATSPQMDARLKDIVRALPAGVPGQTAMGRQFILDHVSEEQLKKSRRPSAMAIASSVTALIVSAGFGVAMASLPPGVVLGVALAGLLLTVGLVAIAILRGIARVRRLAEAGHKGFAARAGVAVTAALVLFVGGNVLNLIESARPQNSPLGRARQAANEVAAIQALRTLNQAEVMYMSSYPANGFACRLATLGGKPAIGPPTADAAQLISDDLVSGKRYGYIFSITCAKGAVGAQESATGYRIVAVPEGANAGARGFCTDESEAIQFDPSGGPNCTEPLL